MEDVIAELAGGEAVALAVEGHDDRRAAGIEAELIVARRAVDGERRAGRELDVVQPGGIAARPACRRPSL